jgi:hypothetical protein
MTQLLAAALVLQLHNFAGVPSSVAVDAASEVTRLYAAVGVSTIWRAAAPSDDRSDVIRVIVLPHETGILSHRADTVMGAAVSTPGSTRLAYVYYRPVRAEAERHAASISQVLACAIAHEIGHLLIPEAGHSPAGLMRARWQRDDFERANQGRMRFSAEQSALIAARFAR